MVLEKQQLFKCLTCEIFPTRGELLINGLDIAQNFDAVRSLIGYCPQFDAIFDYMTVYENLNFFSTIKGIPDKVKDLIIFSLMKEMNLDQYADKRSGDLSGGNKRKLSVAIAMIGNPPIVLLDEPSTGVDPEARRFMWNVIHKISTKRKYSSVILTTHSMEEAETLCRRMGIMVKGQFRCLGTAQEIKTRYGSGYEVDLRINHLDEDDITKKMNLISKTKDDHVNNKDMNNLLNKMGKSKYLTLFDDNNLGREINDEVGRSPEGVVSAKRFLNWIHFTDQILKLSAKLLENFPPNVTVSEFYESNFKLKIMKNEKENTTIGFLFGLFEDFKSEFNITEYGISQTSLEQIFNKFAYELEANNNQEESGKKGVVIDQTYLESLEITSNTRNLSHE